MSQQSPFVFADDALVCNEPWAIERGAQVDGCSKRYALFWETDRAHVAFLPTCGNMCSVLSLNYVCTIENPTRRQVRMMLRAIGLNVEQSENVSLFDAAKMAIDFIEHPGKYPDCQPVYGLLRGAIHDHEKRYKYPIE